MACRGSLRVAQTAWAIYWPKCAWATLGHPCVNHLQTRMNRASSWPKAKWATPSQALARPTHILCVGQWATWAVIG
jgi:hypothetical protein